MYDADSCRALNTTLTDISHSKIKSTQLDPHVKYSKRCEENKLHEALHRLEIEGTCEVNTMGENGSFIFTCNVNLSHFMTSSLSE